MSAKPIPAAETAAMLALRIVPSADAPASIAYVAILASELHRLAPAIKRHAEAACNGEWRDGQRRMAEGSLRALAALDVSIEQYGKRMDRRIARINERLAPLGLIAAIGHDPRGSAISLTSTNDVRVPSNGWSGGWEIG